MSADGLASGATGGPPPTADAQDPLPESNWFWRRVFVFTFSLIGTAALCVILWMLFGLGRVTLTIIGAASRDVRALDNSITAITVISESLANLGFWVIILLLTDRVLYLIAPSAEQAAKMMATVSAWKGGVSTTSTSRATAPDGSIAEDTKTASAGPAPPVPPVAPAPAPAGTAILE